MVQMGTDRGSVCKPGGLGRPLGHDDPSKLTRHAKEGTMAASLRFLTLVFLLIASIGVLLSVRVVDEPV